MNETNYPENWKFEFIDENKSKFGMNIHECALHKFYKKHGGEELLPYICMSDYAIYYLIKNVEMKRTQTIAGGADFCDFRLQKGGATPRGWPPEDREDFIYDTEKSKT